MRARRVLRALGVFAYCYAGLGLVLGILSVVDNHDGHSLGIASARAFVLVMAGTAALVLCSIDARLDALSESLERISES
jgi:hypothetical protein